MRRVVWALSVTMVLGFNFISAPNEADAAWRCGRRCAPRIVCRSSTFRPCVPSRAEAQRAPAPRALTQFEYHQTQKGFLAIDGDNNEYWLYDSADKKWKRLKKNDNAGPPFLLEPQ